MNHSPPEASADATNSGYDTREAVAILTEDRAKRHSQDFIEVKEVSALALREAVLQSATEAGYRVTEEAGRHLIASQEGSDVAVALLANSSGVRVCTYVRGDLGDEAAAEIEYDACARLWVGKSARPVIDKTAKADEKAQADAASKPSPRSAVAVVAELVVSALKKAEEPKKGS